MRLILSWNNMVSLFYTSYKNHALTSGINIKETANTNSVTLDAFWIIQGLRDNLVAKQNLFCKLISTAKAASKGLPHKAYYMYMLDIHKSSFLH